MAHTHTHRVEVFTKPTHRQTHTHRSIHTQLRKSSQTPHRAKPFTHRAGLLLVFTNPFTHRAGLLLVFTTPFTHTTNATLSWK